MTTPKDHHTFQYPFTAIVGQDEMKLALVLNVIDPQLGGVLIMGHRGTAKSTAVRALSSLLPPTAYSQVIAHIEYKGGTKKQTLFDTSTGEDSMPLVDLPLSATEDRVVGALDIEAVLSQGKKSFEPGLIAKAHGGFLYIDEVNLLEDHLVDLLLDVAASGVNVIEREGLSVRHPARFVLVGTGNPEEGDLRPQLLDRFGLYTQVQTISDIEQRVLLVKRNQAFKQKPIEFIQQWTQQQEELRRRILKARDILPLVTAEEALLAKVVELCLMLKIDGHRGELTVLRAASAFAAFHGQQKVTVSDILHVAQMSLRHRLRRDPLEQIDSGEKISKAIKLLFPH